MSDETLVENDPSADLAETETVVKKVRPKELVETVTMEDGKIVDFVGKRRMIKSHTIVDGKVTCRFDFRNGKTVFFTIPEELMLRFAAHGAEQKIGDDTSGLTDVEDCLEAVNSIVDRIYETKQWNQARVASATFLGVSNLAKAVCAVTGKPLVEVQAFLRTKTPKEKAALRINPRVMAELQKLQEGTPQVDTEALLSSLG